MYAYGDWEIDGCQCPVARAFGMDAQIQARYSALVDEYDDMAAGMFSGDETRGTLTDEQARQVWEALLNSHTDTIRQDAKNVADELGWL